MLPSPQLWMMLLLQRQWLLSSETTALPGNVLVGFRIFRLADNKLRDGGDSTSSPPSRSRRHLEPLSSEYHVSLISDSVNLCLNLWLHKISSSPFEKFEGRVLGDANSHASLSMIDNLLIGKVYTNGTQYAVEPAIRWLNGSVTKGNELIMYSEKDVRPLNTLGKQAHPPQLSTRSWFFRQLPQYVSRQVTHDMLEATTTLLRKRRSSLPDDADRLEESTAFPGKRSCCYLYIRTDPYLWNEVFSKEGQFNTRSTELSILNIVHQAVDGANEIFRQTVFSLDDERKYRGFQLKIKRVKIMRPDDCTKTRSSDASLCEEHIDVLNFLNAHSKQNFSDYCLAYTFTARDFDGGTLGLAWSGRTDFENTGGICDVAKRTDNGVKSFNGGIVTILNYGARISMLSLELTLAHEIGHNIGSEHDDEDDRECSPGIGKGGNYVMYPNAISTNEANNKRFSPCSMRNISEVIVPLIENRLSRKQNCLEECRGEFCGNRITEKEEQCDCGFDEDCKKINDTCCEPADADPSRRCRLKVGAQCSRSQGACCSADCTPEKTSHKCYKATEQECVHDVYCSGWSPICPVDDSKYFREDHSFCGQYTKICKKGRCTGSICQLFGMDQCMLTGDIRSGTIDHKKQLCHLACMMPINNNMNKSVDQSMICRDTHESDHFLNPKTQMSGFLLRRGSWCSNAEGYCDVFDVCRPIKYEGPLRRLKDVLMKRFSMKWILRLLEKYWWAVVAMNCGILVGTGILLNVCAAHTKSSNPFVERRTPHRSVSIRYRNFGSGSAHPCALGGRHSRFLVT